MIKRKSKEEAEARYMMHLLAEKRKSNRIKTIVISILLLVIASVLYLIVV